MKRKILYIEDNKDNRILVKKVLEAEGFEVIEACDGLDGVGTAKNEIPDLILMDIDIPGIDGYEATARIKSINKLEHIPIIALTAHVMKGDKDKTLSIGCDGFISKPIDIDKFPDQINEYFDGRKDKPEEENEKRYLKEFSYNVVEKLEEKVSALEVELKKNRELREELKNHNNILEEKVKIRTNQLNKKLKELSIFLETSHALSSTLEFQEILNIIAEKMTISVDISICRIGIIYHAKNTFTIMASHSIRKIDFDREIDKEYKLHDLKIYRELLNIQNGNMDSYKKFLVLKDINISDFEETEKRFLFIQNRGSVAAVPIISNNRLVGIAILNEMRNWNRSPFTEEKMRLCAGIASEAAVAIENALLIKELREANFDSLRALAGALEAKDQYTKGHCDRMIMYALKIADRLHLSEEEIEHLRYAVMLHDIGKIAIRDEILNKPSPLTPEEFNEIKAHPGRGADIINEIKFLQSIAPIVNHHQERWDGKGYPEGLSGDLIPLSSRIISVLDAFDAMTSDRPYRKALSHEYAVEELVRYSGTQFDPQIVNIFIEVIGKNHGL